MPAVSATIPALLPQQEQRMVAICPSELYGPRGRPPNEALTALNAGSFDRLFRNNQDGYALFGDGKIALPGWPAGLRHRFVARRARARYWPK